MAVQMAINMANFKALVRKAHVKTAEYQKIANDKSFEYLLVLK